jgi:hypothetical protein
MFKFRTMVVDADEMRAQLDALMDQRLVVGVGADALGIVHPVGVIHGSSPRRLGAHASPPKVMSRKGAGGYQPPTPGDASLEGGGRPALVR